ncbi:MAG: dicarboxylate/amino acid:cation symporter [bacterium]|nr:dicarboxylate/amino acid:cation symporter [bacterium]
MSAIKRKIKKMNLTTKIMIGLLLGVVAGFLVPSTWTGVIKASQTIGTIYMNALKMMIYPLVFCSLIVGIKSMGSISATGKVAGRAMIYFLSTTFLACIFGIFVPQFLGIGKGASLNLVETKVEVNNVSNILDTITNLIPSNPIASFANGDMLSILVFAVIVGFAILALGRKAQPFMDVVVSVNEISMKILFVVMKFTPIGVFCTILPVIASNGSDTILSVGQALLTTYLVIIVYAIVVYGIVVKFIAKGSPIKFAKAIMPAALNAFGTCSSSATIPISMRCAEDNMKVPKEVTSIVLPLGATINMDAISILMSIMITFFANACGIHLTVTNMIVIVLSNVLLSIGTPGIPNGQVASFAALIQIAGIPTGVMGIFISVSTLSDMIVTMIDVVGDMGCCAVLTHILGYDGKDKNKRKLSSSMDEVKDVMMDPTAVDVVGSVADI